MVGGVGGVGQPEQQGTVTTFGSGRLINARGLGWSTVLGVVNGSAGGDAGVAALARDGMCSMHAIIPFDRSASCPVCPTDTRVFKCNDMQEPHAEQSWPAHPGAT